MNKIVGLVSPTGHQGGAERGLVHLALNLPKFGFEPRVILLQRGPLEDWLAPIGCPVTIIPAQRVRNVYSVFSVTKTLARAIKLSSVVISNQSKGHIYGGIAALTARVPEIWWQQQHPSRIPLDMAASAIPSSVVVCSSDASVQAQRRLTPWRRIETIHLGTGIEEIRGFLGSGEGIRRKFGRDGKRLVGIIGRLQEWKGQEVFLRAAAVAAKRYRDVQFLVVGGAILGWEKDYPERLKVLCNELGIADRTHFAGHQSDVYAWFDALDIVVHASYGDPFDHVLIEALAMGKPLIATSKGGSAEIIENGKSGILVPPGDVRSMGRAITHLLEHPELARQLGAKAMRRANLFSAETMASKFASLAQELADSSRRNKQ